MIFLEFFSDEEIVRIIAIAFTLADSITIEGVVQSCTLMIFSKNYFWRPTYSIWNVHFLCQMLKPL